MFNVFRRQFKRHCSSWRSRKFQDFTIPRKLALDWNFPADGWDYFRNMCEQVRFWRTELRLFHSRSYPLSFKIINFFLYLCVLHVHVVKKYRYTVRSCVLQTCDIFCDSFSNILFVRKKNGICKNRVTSRCFGISKHFRTMCILINIQYPFRVI